MSTLCQPLVLMEAVLGEGYCKSRNSPLTADEPTNPLPAPAQEVLPSPTSNTAVPVLEDKRGVKIRTVIGHTSKQRVRGNGDVKYSGQTAYARHTQWHARAEIMQGDPLCWPTSQDALDASTPYLPRRNELGERGGNSTTSSESRPPASTSTFTRILADMKSSTPNPTIFDGNKDDEPIRPQSGGTCPCSNMAQYVAENAVHPARYYDGQPRRPIMDYNSIRPCWWAGRDTQRAWADGGGIRSCLWVDDRQGQQSGATPNSELLLSWGGNTIYANEHGVQTSVDERQRKYVATAT
ncbi:hypothetical protein BJ912DRAFT_1123824 [Pholiota molesta]|nr:hypothetical protein BJ912DRAFT_1123824 [Pholiota molesta]